MKRYIHLSVIFLIAFLFMSCNGNGSGKKAGDYTPLAEQFVQILVNEEYEKAVLSFDATMKDALPVDKLENVWQNLISQVGHYKKQVGVRQTSEQGFDIVYLTCEFEKASVDIKVVFSDAKEITGLWFLPPKDYKFK